MHTQLSLTSHVSSINSYRLNRIVLLSNILAVRNRLKIYLGYVCHLTFKTHAHKEDKNTKEVQSANKELKLNKVT